jgi:hypothetical protein
MRAGAAVVTFVAMLATAAPAAAADAPLTFATPSPLTTTCEALASEEGLAIKIQSETVAPQKAHLTPGQFSDESEAPVAPEQVCGGLEAVPVTEVAGSGEATLKLHAKAATGGGLSGSLVLAPDAGRVSRLQVEIAAQPPAVAKELAATPLVESLSEELEGSEHGPIWVPVKAGEAPFPTEKQTVGTVSGPNGPVPVTYTGTTRKLSKTTLAVGLEFGKGESELPGLEPGSYSGAVDLAPGDKEAGKVALSVRVAAWWVCALILLALGVLIGLVLQWISAVYLPRSRLLTRIDGLQGRKDGILAVIRGTKAQSQCGCDPDCNPAQGSAEAAKPPERIGEWTKFDIKDLACAQTKLQGWVKKRVKLRRIQIDKPVLEDLEARIAAVEAQIDLLEELPTHAGDLEEALRKLEAAPAVELPPRHVGDTGDHPSLHAEAVKALQGEAIEARDLKPAIEEIDARAKQVRLLLGLEDRLGDLWKAQGTLLNGLADEKAKDKAKDLAKQLESIRHLLWTAENSEDLETAAAEVQDAAKEAAALWPELPERPLMPKSVYANLGGGLARYVGAHLAEDAVIVIGGEQGVTAGGPASPPSPTGPPALPPDPAPSRLSPEAADRRAERAFAVQLAVVIVTAAVVLASGMALLYVGKPWGSCWDYAAALAWGFGLQATTVGLVSSIGGLSGLRLPQSG